MPEQFVSAVSGAPTVRSRVRQRADRGRYDRATVDAILDEGLVAHVAIAAGGQPYALPMLYARDGDRLYLHGSRLSRLVGEMAEGAPICATVTLLDGVVFARSAFHHSINYRSVVVLGRGTAIRDAERKHAALRCLVEHVAAGRSEDARGPSPQELRATEVIELPLAEASAKVRTGPPVDGPEDYALPVWAGVLPLSQATGEPIADDRCELPVPEYVRRWERGHA